MESPEDKLLRHLRLLLRHATEAADVALEIHDSEDGELLELVPHKDKVRCPSCGMERILSVAHHNFILRHGIAALCARCC